MFGIDDLLFGLAAKYLIPLAGDAIASMFSDDSDKQAAKAVTSTVAGAALQVAQQVTGQPITDEGSALAAASAIQADPAKLADYQRAMTERTVAIMAEETKRLAVVNETIRTELTSGSAYVRNMRPTWGYTMCASWAWIMAVIGITIWRDPSSLTANMPQIVTMFGIGASVLGLYVYKRSGEKGAESGLIGPALKAIKGR